MKKRDHFAATFSTNHWTIQTLELQSILTMVISSEKIFHHLLLRKMKATKKVLVGDNDFDIIFWLHRKSFHLLSY